MHSPAKLTTDGLRKQTASATTHEWNVHSASNVVHISVTPENGNAMWQSIEQTDNARQDSMIPHPGKSAVCKLTITGFIP
jgi:hypothetical protein